MIHYKPFVIFFLFLVTFLAFKNTSIFMPTIDMERFFGRPFLSVTSRSSVTRPSNDLIDQGIALTMASALSKCVASYKDWRLLAYQAKAFKRLHSFYSDLHDSQEYQGTFSLLRNAVYPWLEGTTLEWLNISKHDGSGIVVSVANHHFDMISLLLSTLRMV